MLKNKKSSNIFQEDILDNIINNIDSGIIIFDKDRNIICGNKSVANILGINYESLFKLNLQDILRIAKKDEKVENIIKNLKDNFELEVNIKGIDYKFEYTYFDGDDNEKSIINLRRINNEKPSNSNDYIGYVSHELKTPISTIKAYIETLIDIMNNNEFRDKEISMKFLSVVKEECDRMFTIVKELLHISKLDRDIFALEKEKVSVNEFIKKIYTKIEVLAKIKRQNILINISKNINNIYR